MDIDLIGVPMFYGCDREGVEQGPDKLRELGLKELLERKGSSVRDKGNVDVPFATPDMKYARNSKMKYLDEILTVAENLATEVEDSLKSGRLPLVIGGDHSLALGSLAGVTGAIGNRHAVIWIDAHTDINTDQTSPSGNVHGMPLAASMGVGPTVLLSVHGKEKKVHDRNVYVVGARSLDKGEEKLISDSRMTVYRIGDIHSSGMRAVIEDLLRRLKESRISDIHISYDIDSLDKSLVPGTGTPVRNGLMLEESAELVEAIMDTGLVRSIDFVEYNPVLDKDGRTAESCLYMLDVFAGCLGRQSGRMDIRRTGS